MRTHVVIDLETFGNGSNAAIAAIGAVSFTQERSPSIDAALNPGTAARAIDFQRPAFYVNVVGSTGDIDEGTVRWWLAQDERARSMVLGMGYHELSALELFRDWLYRQCGGESSDLVVWAHEEFDLSILNNAYRRHVMAVPWKYRNQRGLRTAFDPFKITSHEPEFADDTISHYALHDAYREARALEWVFKQYERLSPI